MKAQDETQQTHRKRKISLIENNTLRNNTKCKRKNNLFKKCMELSKLCGQDVLLLIFDEEFNKMFRFQSNASFDVNKAKHLLDNGFNTSKLTRSQKRRAPVGATRIFDANIKELGE